MWAGEVQEGFLKELRLELAREGRVTRLLRKGSLAVWGIHIYLSCLLSASSFLPLCTQLRYKEPPTPSRTLSSITSQPNVLGFRHDIGTF